MEPFWVPSLIHPFNRRGVFLCGDDCGRFSKSDTWICWMGDALDRDCNNFLVVAGVTADMILEMIEPSSCRCCVVGIAKVVGASRSDEMLLT